MESVHLVTHALTHPLSFHLADVDSYVKNTRSRQNLSIGINRCMERESVIS